MTERAGGEGGREPTQSFGPPRLGPVPIDPTTQPFPGLLIPQAEEIPLVFGHTRVVALHLSELKKRNAKTYMAYATKYYDYQIAVVFAILLGGLLLLALVVTAIYYICVVNEKVKMRGKKGGITRVPSGRSTVRTRVEPSQQYSPSIQPEVFQQYPQYSPYGGIEGVTNQQAQQQKQPPYQCPTNEHQQAAVRVREVQPEYFQQQGPVSYTTYPSYEQQSYQQHQQAHAAGTPRTTYHMSSV